MANKYKELQWGDLFQERTLPIPVPQPPAVCACPSLTLEPSGNSISAKVKVQLIENINENTRYKLEYRNLDAVIPESNVVISTNTTTEIPFTIHSEFTFSDLDAGGNITFNITNLADTASYEFRIITICINNDNTETILSSAECPPTYTSTELSECSVVENETSDLFDYNIVKEVDGYRIDVLEINSTSWFGIEKLRISYESAKNGTNNYERIIQQPLEIEIGNQSGPLIVNLFADYKIQYDQKVRFSVQSVCFGGLISDTNAELVIADVETPDTIIDPILGPFELNGFELITEIQGDNIPPVIQFDATITPFQPNIYDYTYTIEAIDENGNVINVPFPKEYTNSNQLFDLEDFGDLDDIAKFKLKVVGEGPNGEIFENESTIDNPYFDRIVEVCPEYRFLPLEEILIESGLNAGLYRILIKWEEVNIELEENEVLAGVSFFRLDYTIDGEVTNLEVNANDFEYELLLKPGSSIDYTMRYLCEVDGSNIKEIPYGGYTTPGDSSCPELSVTFEGIPENRREWEEQVFASSQKFIPIDIAINGLNTGLFNQLTLSIYRGSELVVEEVYTGSQLENPIITFNFEEFNPRYNHKAVVLAQRLTSLETEGIDCPEVETTYNGTGEEGCDISINNLQLDVSDNKIVASWEVEENEYNEFYGYYIDITPRPDSSFPYTERNFNRQSFTFEDLEFNQNYKVIVSTICSETNNGQLVLDPITGDVIPGEQGQPTTNEISTEEELVCIAPINVQLEPIGSTQMRVTWVTQGGGLSIDEIGVQYRIEGNTSWATKKVTDLNSNEYTIDSLRAGNNYQVRVFFKCENGNIVYSELERNSTDNPPCESTELTVREIRQGSVDLEWEPIANVEPNETVGYIVKWKTAEESEYTNEKSIVGAQRSATTINGLEVGVDYEFVLFVDCQQDGSMSIASDTVNVSIEECAQVSSINLGEINATTGEVTLSWTISSNAESYVFGYKKVTESTWIDATVNENTITLTNLENVGNYDFRVKSSCAVGESDWTYLNNQKITLIECSLPDYSLESNGPHSLKVTINENPSNFTYPILYRLDYKEEGDLLFETTEEFKENVYIIEGLNPNILYNVRLIKKCNGDESVTDEGVKKEFTQELPVVTEPTCAEDYNGCVGDSHIKGKIKIPAVYYSFSPLINIKVGCFLIEGVNATNSVSPNHTPEALAKHTAEQLCEDKFQNKYPGIYARSIGDELEICVPESYIEGLNGCCPPAGENAKVDIEFFRNVSEKASPPRGYWWLSDEVNNLSSSVECDLSVTENDSVEPEEEVATLCNGSPESITELEKSISMDYDFVDFFGGTRLFNININSSVFRDNIKKYDYKVFELTKTQEILLFSEQNIQDRRYTYDVTNIREVFFLKVEIEIECLGREKYTYIQYLTSCERIDDLLRYDHIINYTGIVNGQHTAEIKFTPDPIGFESNISKIATDFISNNIKSVKVIGVVKGEQSFVEKPINKTVNIQDIVNNNGSFTVTGIEIGNTFQPSSQEKIIEVELEFDFHNDESLCEISLPGKQRTDRSEYVSAHSGSVPYPCFSTESKTLEEVIPEAITSTAPVGYSGMKLNAYYAKELYNLNITTPSNNNKLGRVNITNSLIYQQYRDYIFVSILPRKVEYFSNGNLIATGFLSGNRGYRGFVIYPTDTNTSANPISVSYDDLRNKTTTGTSLPQRFDSAAVYFDFLCVRDQYDIPQTGLDSEQFIVKGKQNGVYDAKFYFGNVKGNPTDGLIL